MTPEIVRYQLAFVTQVIHTSDCLRGYAAGLEPPMCDCQSDEPVYVFGPEVRSDCPGYTYTGPGAYRQIRCPTWKGDTNCKTCQGRGQVAVEDGWTWWRACKGVKIDVWLDLGQYGLTDDGLSQRWCFRSLSGNHYEWHDDPELAFFQALYQAVGQKPGIVWPEVE